MSVTLWCWQKVQSCVIAKCENSISVWDRPETKQHCARGRRVAREFATQQHLDSFSFILVGVDSLLFSLTINNSLGPGHTHTAL